MMIGMYWAKIYENSFNIRIMWYRWTHLTTKIDTSRDTVFLVQHINLCSLIFILMNVKIPKRIISMACLYFIRDTRCRSLDVLNMIKFFHTLRNILFFIECAFEKSLSDIKREILECENFKVLIQVVYGKYQLNTELIKKSIGTS